MVPIFKVTEQNCNALIIHFTEKREVVEKKIVSLIANGEDITFTELEYNQYCNIIENLCFFRTTHNCLIEGDPGFEYIQKLV